MARVRDQTVVEQAVNGLGGDLCRRNCVQRRSVDVEQHLGKLAFGADRQFGFDGVMIKVECPQHVREPRFGASAIDQNLLSRQDGHQNRLVDRKAGAEQDVGTVVFAAHRLLAIFLMKLEEEVATVRVEEAVERIQAVLVVVYDQVRGLDGEHVAQQLDKHGLGAPVTQRCQAPDLRGPAGRVHG